MFKMRTALAAGAAIMLAAIAPALAGETLTLSNMMVADIGHEMSAVSDAKQTDARIVRAAPADIPPFEQIAHIQATAIVQIALNAKGSIVSSTLLASSGRDRLDKSALRAVRESTYAPATINGTAVGGSYTVEVSFDPAY
jgi:TonB family protein